MTNAKQIQSFADLSTLSGVLTLRSDEWAIKRAVELEYDPEEGELVSMSGGPAVVGRWLTGPHKGQHVTLVSNGRRLGCSVDLDGGQVDCQVTEFVGDDCDRVRAMRG